MRDHPNLFRLTAGVALTALLWDITLPLTAAAQPAPPPLPAPYQDQTAPNPAQNQADPPARVGRIAGITGAASLREQNDTQWSPASVNFPVSTGDAFWTQPGAEAQLEISASRIVLAPTTEFNVATLDDAGLQAVAAHGESYLHLRDLTPNEAWSIQTPRGLVRLSGDGRYDVVVGTTEAPTLVTVVEGSAVVEGPGLSLQVASGQTATITGTDNFQGSIGTATRTPFLTAQLNAERPRSAPPARVPADVALMPGGGDLATYGAWSEAPQYGEVWYPQVSPGWVPYRDGHWAYVAPWGWTWIDAAPWGFAPFHYGRWVEVEGRWAWTPGQIPVAGPPVYAPALVAFVGIGTGVALGAALAFGSIGWVPLGPREQYHPWYHASDNYIRQVNVSHVTTINNNVTVNNFVNRGAATAVPANAMTQSSPVQGLARPLRPQELTAAQPIVGQQPLRPGAATAGVTPVVARQFNLPATAARTAPGPAFQPQAARPQAAGPNGFVRPGVAAAGAAAGAAAIPALRSPAGAQPGAGQPAARTVPPSVSTQGVRPAEPVPPGARPALATPPATRPIGPHPGEQRAIEPGAVRPQVETRQPAPRFVPPAAAPQVPRAIPQATAPQIQHATPPAAAPIPQAQHVPPPAAVAPRPEAQRAAPPAPRPEPIRAAPPAPRPEPVRAAPPAPRPEPVRAAAPAPRPEPIRAAAPAEREKKPNEH